MEEYLQKKNYLFHLESLTKLRYYPQNTSNWMSSTSRNTVKSTKNTCKRLKKILQQCKKSLELTPQRKSTKNYKTVFDNHSQYHSQQKKQKSMVEYEKNKQNNRLFKRLIEISSLKASKDKSNHKYTQSLQCPDQFLRLTVCSKANTIAFKTEQNGKYYYTIHNIIFNNFEGSKNLKYKIHSTKKTKLCMEGTLEQLKKLALILKDENTFHISLIRNQLVVNIGVFSISIQKMPSLCYQVPILDQSSMKQFGTILLQKR